MIMIKLETLTLTNPHFEEIVLTNDLKLLFEYTKLAFKSHSFQKFILLANFTWAISP